MDVESNEDLIQATMRRVAQARAAQKNAAEHPSGPADAPGTAAPASERAPRNEVEDAIEATIRRVTKSQAARASDPEPVDGDNAAEIVSAEEDPIEATIRRVAEAAEARASTVHDQQDVNVTTPSSEASDETIAAIKLHTARAGENPDSASEAEDAIAATIRRVAEAAEARERVPSDVREEQGITSDDEPPRAAIPATAAHTDVEPVPNTPDSMPVLATIEEARQAAIEETIRRVAVSQAARAAAEEVTTREEAPSHGDASGEDYAARVPTPMRSDFAPSNDEQASMHEDWPAAIGRLEDDLRQIRRELHTLAMRCDALVSIVDRGAPAEQEPAQRPTPAVADDDDWNVDAPLTQSQFGAPPRAAIYRDPTPMTATAEHLIEQEADAEPSFVEQAPPTPIVAAAAAPAPDGRRGFELLPRTYRITVEDKRRGVDLVPLHRALRSLEGMRDMSLLSYSNGVAMVSLETAGAVEPDALAKAVSRAMGREAEIEVHNEQTMVVKLAED